MTPCLVKALSTVHCTDGESALIEKYFAVVGCGGGGGGEVVRWCRTVFTFPQSHYRVIASHNTAPHILPGSASQNR